jgi:hypothetical protein
MLRKGVLVVSMYSYDTLLAGRDIELDGHSVESGIPAWALGICAEIGRSIRTCIRHGRNKICGARVLKIH